MAVRIKRIAETFWEGDLRHAESGQSTTLMVRLTPRPGLTPSEVGFLCEMEEVTVIPRQRLEGLELLGVSS